MDSTNDRVKLDELLDRYYALLDARGNAHRVARLIEGAYEDIAAFVDEHPEFRGVLPPRSSDPDDVY